MSASYIVSSSKGTIHVEAACYELSFVLFRGAVPVAELSQIHTEPDRIKI